MADFPLPVRGVRVAIKVCVMDEVGVHTACGMSSARGIENGSVEGGTEDDWDVEEEPLSGTENRVSSDDASSTCSPCTVSTVRNAMDLPWCNGERDRVKNDRIDKVKHANGHTRFQDRNCPLL